MNKKLGVIVALVIGAAGFMLAQGTLKAQDNTDNSAMANSDSGSTTMNSDSGSAAAPVAQ